MELPVTAPVSGDHMRLSYTIETRNLSCTHQGACNRFIVENVNMEAKPGEITAIAGPSGAGKTTLLEILAGKIRPAKVSGDVLINGKPMSTECFHRLSGYVTQDDALFPLLTVEETLRYSALLRVPGGRRVAYQQTKAVTKELGLEHIAGSRVDGISGGERRRVSIGVELIHDPMVLLIDEPTSGLDSASALHMVSLLRLMAVNQKKTIVLTIHQPGFRILELLDRILLLWNGHVLHHGSLQLLEERLKNGGHRVPSHINVLEFSIEITDRIGQHIQTAGSIEGRRHHGGHGVEKRRSSYANSRLQEVLILGERFSKNIFRTKELFATRVSQAVLVGCILGTVYMKVGNDAAGKVSLQTRLGFFAFTLSFLLSSTTEGLPIFLQERRIFMRETLGGAYRVSSYVIANTLVFFPFLLMVGILYSTPVYWLVGLRPDIDGFLYFTLVVWMVVLMSNSFTACCSALVPNFIMGTSIIAGLMGSFFLFSGYFIAQENIPSYWIFMHYLSLFKYPFESLMINEYGGKGGSKCLENVGGGECFLYGHEYLKQQGLKLSQKWTNLAVMFSFIFGYRLLCFFILWLISYRNRK